MIIAASTPEIHAPPVSGEDRNSRQVASRDRPLTNIRSRLDWLLGGSEKIDFAVGGFVPFSSLDWPDHLAAVVFAQGCPLRCSYCHNPHLQICGEGELGFSQVIAALTKRRQLLDGVVFSGGEPCGQDELPQAIAAVRELGLQVGLHTAGIHPGMLAKVLPQLAWVGFDAKAPQDAYFRVTGTSAWQRAEQSLDLLLAGDCAFEVRTTWSPELFSADALFDLAQNLARRGVAHYALQRVRKPIGDGNSRRWEPASTPPAELLEKLAGLFRHFAVR